MDSGSLAAQAQNDTPSLAEPWDFETQTISGVNLGGYVSVLSHSPPLLLS